MGSTGIRLVQDSGIFLRPNENVWWVTQMDSTGIRFPTVLVIFLRQKGSDRWAWTLFTEIRFRRALVISKPSKKFTDLIHDVRKSFLLRISPFFRIWIFQPIFDAPSPFLTPHHPICCFVSYSPNRFLTESFFDEKFGAWNLHKKCRMHLLNVSDVRAVLAISTQWKDQQVSIVTNSSLPNFWNLWRTSKFDHTNTKKPSKISIPKVWCSSCVRKST